MSHEEIQRVIFQTLEGHLRSILGTLTVEEVNSDRASFAQKLTSEARAGPGAHGHWRGRTDHPGHIATKKATWTPWARSARRK